MSMIRHSRAKRSSSQGRSQASLARSSAIMASGTLVSRVLGMVRNALIVMALGGVVPFLSFIVEKRIHAETLAQLDANPQATKRY